MPEPLIAGRIVRGLTLWRPWPWTFTHLPPEVAKRVENRDWPMPRYIHGGWLALHSGKRFDRDAAEHMAMGTFGDAAQACPQRSADHPDSVITCLARAEKSIPVAEVERFHPELTLWAFGEECWLTPEIVVLPEPVPCRGAQGLWKLPPDVFEAVAAGYEKARTA